MNFPKLDYCMLRIVRTTVLSLTLAASVAPAFAFSLLGPFEGYQVQRIGYAHVPPVNADLGGPMNLGEEYRWNVRTITYGIDPSFTDYFGQRGAEEIRKAVAVLNALPPFSKMSTNLNEFPLTTRRVNYEASGLLLADVKSEALACLVEQMGLAGPERYTWTLFARIVVGNTVNYNVIMRNFDPVTTEHSKYVNGTLYTYSIFEFPSPPYDWADAVEFPVDPLAPTYTSVAAAADILHGGALGSGEYLTGLTRDDVGGLRYLYRPQNYNVEGPLPDMTLTSGVPGSPVDPNATNTVVNTALRPGVDKITFVEGKYDSQLGPFISVTNRYVDYYVANGRLIKQFTQRILTNAPDIIFAAADLGGGLIARTDTAGWINNDLVNGTSVLAGPGVISPTSVITFNKTGPFLVNTTGPGSFITDYQEVSAVPSLVWGAFDGTTNRPIVFPSGTSIDAFESHILRP